MNTSSEESLISVQHGSERASTPDLVHLDTEHLGDIIVCDKIIFNKFFAFSFVRLNFSYVFFVLQCFRNDNQNIFK